MTNPRIKTGLFGAFKRGEHFVMPEREQPSGGVIYGVWVITQRARNFEGTAVKVAEFVSKREAHKWMRLRNTETARSIG